MQAGRMEEMRTKEVHCMLTKGSDDGARDAVGHTDREDTHGPSVFQAKLELIGLTLQIEKCKNNIYFF